MEGNGSRRPAGTAFSNVPLFPPREERTIGYLDDVQLGPLILGELLLPLLPGPAQGLALVSDGDMECNNTRRNRTGVGHPESRCGIQRSDRHNEKVLDLLLLKREGGGKLVLDPLVVMPDPKKHHDDPGAGKKLRGGN